MALSAVLPRVKRSGVKPSIAKPAPARKPATFADPQEVARVAYELYDKRGRINGYDKQDWFEAERIVIQRRSR